MDVMILMAGRGTRFQDRFADVPKPLVPLHGVPLVRWVVENLRFQNDQRFIFVCLEDHLKSFDLSKEFSTWEINFEIVPVSTVTEGAACSALLAKKVFQNNELLIANSDQFVEFDREAFLNKSRLNDGCIMSMAAEGKKWSYIQTDATDRVTLVKEKEPISSTGTVGIYYFKSGDFFSQAVEDMIRADDRYNNEFYLAPCYNYLIKRNKKIGHYFLHSPEERFIGLGTSADFELFEKDPTSKSLYQKIFL